MAGSQDIVAAEDLKIESRPFKVGQKVGELRDGKTIVPTAPGVEFGHIEARLNLGSLVVASPGSKGSTGNKKGAGDGDPSTGATPSK